jgi:hypothetical protein
VRLSTVLQFCIDALFLMLMIKYQTVCLLSRCVLAELFLEGQPLFELSQLLAYRRGQYDPSHTLEKVFMSFLCPFFFQCLNLSLFWFIRVLILWTHYFGFSYQAFTSQQLYTPFLLLHHCLHAISDGAIRFNVQIEMGMFPVHDFSVKELVVD